LPGAHRKSRVPGLQVGVFHLWLAGDVELGDGRQPLHGCLVVQTCARHRHRQIERVERLLHRLEFVVEKDHFDEEKSRKAEKRAQKAAAKKRKQKTGNEGRSSPHKRAHISGSQPTALQVRQPPNQEVTAIEGDSASSESESDAEASEQLNERYTARPVDQSKTRKKRRIDKDIEPAMDDLINAKSRGFPCRRKPSNAYFQNNKAGQYIASIVLISTIE